MLSCGYIHVYDHVLLVVILLVVVGLHSIIPYHVPHTIDAFDVSCLYSYDANAFGLVNVRGRTK